jgi:hypothetical protein
VYETSIVLPSSPLVSADILRRVSVCIVVCNGSSVSLLNGMLIIDVRVS